MVGDADIVPERLSLGSERIEPVVLEALLNPCPPEGTVGESFPGHHERLLDEFRVVGCPDLVDQVDASSRILRTPVHKPEREVDVFLLRFHTCPSCRAGP